jgi:hypothetical protein
MSDFEETLKNIDVFCKVLAKKIADEENGETSGIVVEPMEKLLYKKCITREQAEMNRSPSHFIPVPQLEEPLVDIIEDENCVRILMQEHCSDNKIRIHSRADGIEICKTECHKDADGTKVCQDKCQKLPLLADKLQIENITAKCNNNSVFEANIPKK